MFVFIISFYIIVCIAWLVLWGGRFAAGYYNARRTEATALLFFWAWPVIVAGFLLYGIYYVVRAAVGRE